MAKDLIYYASNVTLIPLGEIQSDFNMSIVIDGTKDSLQVDVDSFVRDALLPNTIVWHRNTNTWWVVQKDQVKRNANEDGFYYNHNLSLLGAIDLLKNRDLTDCGFNASNYTIDTFIKKLFKLSNFERNVTIQYGNSIDKDQVVKYIKSYENYTLLSALRDFLNDYNCEAKLSFTTRTGLEITIDSTILTIIPRTGNIDLTPISIDTFEDVRESINADKESFGTTVISNAQNVISSIEKTYPQIGGMKLIADKYEVSTLADGYLKLPSPAYKVNWVKAISPIRMGFNYGDNFLVYGSQPFFPQDDASFDKYFNIMLSQSTNAEFQLALHNNKEKLKQLALGLSQVTFYDGFEYNPHTKVISKGTAPYLVAIEYDGGITNMVCADKDTYDRFAAPKLHGLYWERGSDKIQGFDCFTQENIEPKVPYASSTDARFFGFTSQTISLLNGYLVLAVGADSTSSWAELSSSEVNRITNNYTVWQVNYVPMSDLKIKQDNENDTRDIQLYNQNGKLNDGVALSKMIDSYSKEIENPTITRYMHYTNFSDIPQIGQIVNDGNTKYVINNISYDFYMCESNSVDTNNYYIECEFTLAPYISTKSIMTSPNTNVRDYGIPQKYNVKRRQTYRDYYEFAYSPIYSYGTPYTPLNKYLTFDIQPMLNEYDHTALIKITYDEEVNGHLNWYYQLNTTVYAMARSIYEVIDFEDNNIIGYDVQNTTTGFNMSNIWNNERRNICTPVSYVDDKGKFKGITLQMASKEDLDLVYSSFELDNNVMLSSHCFIGEEVYNQLVDYEEPHISEELTNSYSFDVSPTYGDIIYTFTKTKQEIGFPNDFTPTTDNILSLLDVFLEENAQYKDSNDFTFDVLRYENGSFVFRVVVFQHGMVGTFNLSFKVKYYYETTNLSDYYIDEQDYDKDPIEVPVFEYMLQVGNTKQVDVGDNILSNKECQCALYSWAIVDEEVTMLNYGKYTNLAKCVATGGRYIDGEREFRVLCQYALMNFEDNNKKLRIKFYNSRSAYFIGNEDQDIVAYDHIEDLTGVPQQNVKNHKAIVIFKNYIRDVKHDDNEDTNELDYEQDLMFIIHNPPNSVFDDNDLVLDVNYYKLK